ncbi:MAG: sugar transferase [Acidimicrobiales bacterium]
MTAHPDNSSGAVHLVDDIELVDARHVTLYERHLKRPIDLIGAAVLIVVTALTALVALGVLLALGRPVVFRQTRVTKGGQPFTMIKFRSMRPEDKPFDDGQYHAPKDDDPRHTTGSAGSSADFSRRAPQLWNVLKGDMSLIGPRPELPPSSRRSGSAITPVTRCGPA